MCNQTASLEHIIQYVNYIGLLRTLYNNVVAKCALNLITLVFHLSAQQVEIHVFEAIGCSAVLDEGGTRNVSSRVKTGVYHELS